MMIVVLEAQAELLDVDDLESSKHIEILQRRRQWFRQRPPVHEPQWLTFPLHLLDDIFFKTMTTTTMKVSYDNEDPQSSRLMISF